MYLSYIFILRCTFCVQSAVIQPVCWLDCQQDGVKRGDGKNYSGTAVVDFTRSITKLVLQSCTLGCLSSVSMMKLR